MELGRKKYRFHKVSERTTRVNAVSFGYCNIQIVLQAKIHFTETHVNKLISYASVIILLMSAALI